MLARLDQIEGVERSRADRAGTLVCVSLAAAADPDKVAEQVAKVFAEEKRQSTRLTGEDLKQALAREKWYGPDELSAIEFRTLAVRRVRGFAESEKLDQDTAAKLVQIAEEEWDRLANAADSPERKRPGGGTDWNARCVAFAAAFIGRAKDLLTPPQVERLKQARDGLLGGKPLKPGPK